MLNVFENKKNSILESEATVQAPKANYMSAKEALKLASKKWSTLPTEQIFEKIEKYARKGDRSVHFSDAYINGLQLTTLRDLGYKVEIYTSDDCHPFFVVSW